MYDNVVRIYHFFVSIHGDLLYVDVVTRIIARYLGIIIRDTNIL